MKKAIQKSKQRRWQSEAQYQEYRRTKKAKREIKRIVLELFDKVKKWNEDSSLQSDN